MVVDPYRLHIYNLTKQYYKDFPEFPSIKYTNFETISIVKRYNNTEIVFKKGDMIDEACRLKQAGNNPALHNMAAWGIAGGGVELGCPAQEEECFRRSNYFKTFTQKYHPFGILDTLLSKDVEYYRKGYNDNYELMEQPVKIDMIAAPAVCQPEITSDGKFFKHEQDIKLMEYKIHMLVHIAIRNKNDILVLSAWGCGAFECPVYHMAKIFKAVLSQYDGVFSKVVFCIMGNNYEPFRSAFLE